MDGEAMFRLSYIFLIIAIVAIGLMVILMAGMYFEDVQNGKTDLPDTSSRQVQPQAPADRARVTLRVAHAHPHPGHHPTRYHRM